MLEILQAGRTVTLAMVDNDEPYLVALNYGVEVCDGNLRLWLHSAPDGRKIDCVRRNRRVCFTVVIAGDILTGATACDCSMRYRSIVGYGTVRIVEDEREKRTGLDMIMRHYTGKSDMPYKAGLTERTTVLCIDIERITAKERL